MIQLKRGSQGSDLDSYIPPAGQAVYDSTNICLKIGDGINSFADLPAICGISPNLLINSNMVGAINQRGQSSFSDMHTYTIDRWMLMYGSASYSSANGMTLDDYSQICQYIEGLEGFVGKTFTLSAFIDGSVQTLTAELSTSLIASGKLSFVYTNTGYCQVNVSGPGLVKWVKFEIGGNATPFVPQGYQTELIRCKRYYQKLGHNSLNGVYLKDINMADIHARFIPMRNVPTMVDNVNTLVVNISGKGQATMSITDKGFSAAGGNIAFQGTLSNNFNCDNGYSVHLADEVELDGEIY